MTTIPTTSEPAKKPLAADEILRIAREDAERVYKDLERFRITIGLEPDGWHVDYRLTKPFVAGGGPHYVIDAQSGTILHKRYEQ
jgi:hypothetical protein